MYNIAMTEIKKENVLEYCSHLLMEGSPESARAAMNHAVGKGVDIHFDEVKELADIKTKIHHELVL